MSDATSPKACAHSPSKIFFVTLLRISIGWHFLYEGVVKQLEGNWSAVGYLESSTGPLSEFFKQLASDANMMNIVNQLNIWGLIGIGACLMLGLLIRTSALFGIVLLGLYYLAHPPFFGPQPLTGVEGHYLIVNKNLVELFALAVVLAVPTASLGLDRYLCRRGKAATAKPSKDGEAKVEPASTPGKLSRRAMIGGLTGVPFAGGFAVAVGKQHGWFSYEEENLVANNEGGGEAGEGIDGVSGASKTFKWAQLDDLKGKVPHGKIGDWELSRMILGGNLIGGWAHARDLIYVSKLVKAYHHQEKVFETFRLAEACGITTILTNPLLCETINEYWKSGGGKIQFVSDCGGKDVLAMIQKSIDNGATACYIQGGVADKLVEEKKFDLIEQGLELIRKNKLPAGIGAHKLSTVQTCVDRGYAPDFWMKTLHRTNYWSARPEEEKHHDNIWCENPDDTIAYMKELPQPWIAFKILAAGAIHPEVGFRYALENGADFLCVGMYDFQLVENVNLALGLFDQVQNGKMKRERRWMESIA